MACDPLVVPQSSLRDSPALRKSCDEPAARVARLQVSSLRPAKPTGLGCGRNKAPRLLSLRVEGCPRLSWRAGHTVSEKALVPASSSEAHSNCVRSKTGNLSNKKLSTQHCATQSSADAQRKMQCDDLTRCLLEMTAKQHHLHGREDRSATKNQPNSDSQARTATGVLVRVGRSWLTEAVPGHERLRRATSISRLCTALADESLFQSRNATS